MLKTQITFKMIFVYSRFKALAGKPDESMALFYMPA
jgi:hypothetical protein